MRCKCTVEMRHYVRCSTFRQFGGHLDLPALSCATLSPFLLLHNCSKKVRKNLYDITKPAGSGAWQMLGNSTRQGFKVVTHGSQLCGLKCQRRYSQTILTVAEWLSPTGETEQLINNSNPGGLLGITAREGNYLVQRRGNLFL